MVNVSSGWVVPGRRAKLVTSPRGTLSQWALGRTRVLKNLLWPLQRRVLERANLLHATSSVEYDEIRALGFTAPVAIIPNGIDLPPLVDRATVSPRRTLLFLSRIHPTKGLDRLLHAWRHLQRVHPAWRLVIAGRGTNDYVNEIRQLANSLQLQRVTFPGPLFGQEKSQAYFDAELFVLPTHSENFGMVVAEALAHACPVVVSRGAPWPRTATEGCGWWVNPHVDVLSQTLDEAMRLSPDHLANMGRKGRDWMGREYGWDTVAQQMEAAYQWVLNDGSEAPAWVKAH
jgi:glycosyltransferase involved in cell wall biosynthesis